MPPITSIDASPEAQTARLHVELRGAFHQRSYLKIWCELGIQTNIVYSKSQSPPCGIHAPVGYLTELQARRCGLAAFFLKIPRRSIAPALKAIFGCELVRSCDCKTAIVLSKDQATLSE